MKQKLLGFGQEEEKKGADPIKSNLAMLMAAGKKKQES